MSNFDPITYSAVNQLKPFVGQQFLVSQNFYNENYVETGQFISSETYPKLTATLGGTWDPIASTTVKNISPVNTTGAYGTSASFLGFIWLTFEYNNRLFVLFNNSSVTTVSNTSTFTLCGTTNTDLSTMTVIRTIPFSTSPFTVPNGYKGPVNNRIYLSNNTFVDLAAFVDPNNTSWLVSMVLPTALSSRTNWRLAYGNGVYVGASLTASNDVIYSTDGITFQSTSGLYTGTANGICFGAGRFVIMTNSPTSASDNTIVHSTDGITWTSTRGATTGYTVPANGFEYSASAGCFVTTCQNALTLYQRSTNGISWTTVTAPASGSREGGVYLLPNGAFINSLNWTSSDGTTWTAFSPAGKLNPSNDSVFSSQAGLNSAPNVYSYNQTSFQYVNRQTQPAITFGSRLVVLTVAFNVSTADQLYATSLDFPTGDWSTPTMILAPINSGVLSAVSRASYIEFNGNIQLSLAISTLQSTVNVSSTPLNNISSNVNIAYSQIAGSLSSDNGQTWQDIIISTPGYPIRFATFAAAGGKFHIMGYYIATRSPATYRTVIGTSVNGINWTWTVQTTGQTTPVGSSVPTIGVDKNGTTYYWVVSDQTNSRVVYSNDLGQTWQSFGPTSGVGNVMSILPATNGAYIFYYSPGNLTNPYNLYWVTSSNVVKRFDTLPATINTNSPSNFGFNGNNLALFAGSFTMYYSNDNGTSWQTYTIPSTLPNSPAPGNIVIYNNTLIVQDSLSTLWAISLSILSGQTWLRLPFAPPSITTYYARPLIDGSGTLGYYVMTSSSVLPNSYLLSNQSPLKYFLPAITSSVTGSKWVVKAR